MHAVRRELQAAEKLRACARKRHVCKSMTGHPYRWYTHSVGETEQIKILDDQFNLAKSELLQAQTELECCRQLTIASEDGDHEGIEEFIQTEFKTRRRIHALLLKHDKYVTREIKEMSSRDALTGHGHAAILQAELLAWHDSKHYTRITV